MAEQTLRTWLELDTTKFNRGIDGAKKQVDSFDKTLGKAKGGIKDAAGAIDGMGRAFDGSVQGAVGGLRDLMGLVTVSPWTAMAAAAAGAFTAISKGAENAANAIAEKLAKDIAEFKKHADGLSSARESSARAQRELDKPESPSRQAIDFAAQELEAAKKLYEQEKLSAQQSRERIALIREANRSIEEYAKAFNVSREEAAFKFAPQGKDATGQSPQMQKQAMTKLGFGVFSDDVVFDALKNYSKLENLSEKSLESVEKAKSRMLEAQQRFNQEQKAYDDARVRESEDSLKKANDREAALQEERLRMMADGHKEAADLAKKAGEQSVRDREENAKRESSNAKRAKKATESEDESFRRSVKDARTRIRSSEFDNSADVMARIGGTIGRGADPRLRAEDIRNQRLEDLKRLGEIHNTRLEEIKAALLKDDI